MSVATLRSCVVAALQWGLRMRCFTMQSCCLVAVACVRLWFFAYDYRLYADTKLSRLRFPSIFEPGIDLTTQSLTSSPHTPPPFRPALPCTETAFPKEFVRDLEGNPFQAKCAYKADSPGEDKFAQALAKRASKIKMPAVQKYRLLRVPPHSQRQVR